MTERFLSAREAEGLYAAWKKKTIQTYGDGIDLTGECLDAVLYEATVRPGDAEDRGLCLECSYYQAPCWHPGRREGQGCPKEAK